MADTNEAIVVQFLASAYPEALLAQPEFQALRALFVQAGRGVSFSFAMAEMLASRMRGQVQSNGLEAWLELTSLLGKLAQKGGVALAGATYRNQRSFKMGSRLGRIIDHIEARCDDRFPLEDAARFAGLTPSSFARFFRKMTGRTFVEFRNACRIHNACRTLAETDYSILEIALESGFQNLANFNRQFRKSIGMPPRDYRKLRNPAGIRPDHCQIGDK